VCSKNNVWDENQKFFLKPASSSWNGLLLPHQVYYSKDKKSISIPHFNDAEDCVVEHTEQTAGYILLKWTPLEGEPMLENGKNPRKINSYGIHRHFEDGILHSYTPDEPAISVKRIHALWDSPTECEENNTTYRPGPNQIMIRNYQEYWNHGEFSHAKWDGILLKWWLGFETSMVPSDYVTNGNIIKNQKSVEKILDLMQSVNAPMAPLINEFFNHTTDEFRFLEIMNTLKNNVRF
jgi:hypothetical protein